MDRLISSLIFLLCCFWSAGADVYPTLILTVSSDNGTQLNAVQNAVSNRLNSVNRTNLASRFSQVEAMRETNGSGVIRLSYTLTFSQTNAGWILWWLAQTNAIGSRVNIHASYHLCGEPGSCRNYNLTGFVETNR